MERTKTQYLRTNTKEAFISAMLQRCPEDVKTFENPNGLFTCCADFLRAYERSRNLSKRKVTAGGSKLPKSEVAQRACEVPVVQRHGNFDVTVASTRDTLGGTAIHEIPCISFVKSYSFHSYER